MGIIISRRHQRENVTSIEMPSRCDSKLTGAKTPPTSNAIIWKSIKDVHKSLFSRKIYYLPSVVFAVVLFVGGFFVSLFKCASMMKEVDWAYVALTMQGIGGIIILYYLVLRLAKYYAEWKLSHEESEKETQLLLEEDERMKHLFEEEEAEEEKRHLLKESEQWLQTERKEVLTTELIADHGDIQQSTKSVQYDDIITDCHLTSHTGNLKKRQNSPCSKIPEVERDCFLLQEMRVQTILHLHLLKVMQVQNRVVVLHPIVVVVLHLILRNFQIFFDTVLQLLGARDSSNKNIRIKSCFNF